MTIINDENEISGTLVTWDKIGQTVEGTYVGKKKINTRFGHNVAYEIKDANESILLVVGRQCINGPMKHIKVGQIVGFKYMQDLKSDKGSAFKDIKVYANSGIVDEKWLKEQAEQIESGDEEISVNKIKFDEEPQAQVKALSEDLVKEISELATAKLGATTAEDIKAKVMESTKLAWVEANLPQILEALKQLPEKK